MQLSKTELALFLIVIALALNLAFGSNWIS